MSKTYTTIQGDMWDSIAYKQYGSELQMNTLLKANQEYRDTVVFPAGIKLVILDIETKLTVLLPPWKR